MLVFKAIPSQNIVLLPYCRIVQQMSYQLAPIKRESVITRAAQEICRFIADEKLRPGEVLPTSAHLTMDETLRDASF